MCSTHTEVCGSYYIVIIACSLPQEAVQSDIHFDWGTGGLTFVDVCDKWMDMVAVCVCVCVCAVSYTHLRAHETA